MLSKGPPTVSPLPSKAIWAVSMGLTAFAMLTLAVAAALYPASQWILVGTAGLTLLAVTAVSSVWALASHALNRFRLRTVVSLIPLEDTTNFVTDAAGQVFWSNETGHLMGRNALRLEALLAGKVADAAGLIAELLGKSGVSGRAEIERTLADRRLCLSVRIVSGRYFVWALKEEPLSETAVEKVPEEASHGEDAFVKTEVATPVFRIPEAAQAGLFETLPVPLIKLSAAGEIVLANRSARELMDDDIPPGRLLSQLVSGLGRSVTDWLSEAVQGRGLNRSEFLQVTKQEKDVFVQVTLKTVPEDPKADLIAVLNDATELKTLEAQFVQSQKMQAIGQLAGGVAHDFNNLLTAISGHCDLLLLRHDQSDPEYADLVQIHQNANRAASLVGQLLAFSRKQTLQPEVVDLRETLAELGHLLNRLVGERISLSLNHDPDLDPIRADKRQLEQVIMNLVVNARDAMPDGGEISIETKKEVLDQAVQRSRASVPPGPYSVVRVTDHGTGIPPDKLAKVFEPFFTTKRTGEGTGLGLSTAYGIIKQTGGFIFVESEVGEGTTFILYFPAHKASSAQAALPSKEESGKLETHSGGVVLLVEDEAPVRAFASRALRLRGYTVLEADCAEQALDTLEDESLQVDIFVTDVIMPGMDGPTWVQHALKQRPDTRVVFVSGYAEDALTDHQTRIPNSIFLPKPFSLNDLTSTVHNQLNNNLN